MFDKEFYDKMTEMHSDMKHIVKWSQEHDDLDIEKFKDVNKKIDFVTKIAYMGLGGLAVIQVLISFLK